MSDEYEDFDAEAEDTLDALLAVHQSSLLEVVGSALDLCAGLGLATAAEASIHPSVGPWMPVEAGSRDLGAAINTMNATFVWTTVPSEALHSALNALQSELVELDALGEQISQRASDCPAPPGRRLTPERAARLAYEELGRIRNLLNSRSLTKGSAASEFCYAEHYLRGQMTGWTGVLKAADRRKRSRMRHELWLRDCFTSRYDSLLLLREKIVKLFEESEESAYQLS
ncbi:hypothetical protein ACFQ8S_32540 [Streptomyces virginiae]|uniref:hypothetical protein n=1 Tax=Streptomyces virginiae TaxID=1961 RepID=UPI0036C52756